MPYRVCHGFINDLKFVRALINKTCGNKFNKFTVERNILEWMPYKVRNDIQHNWITSHLFAAN